MDAAGIWLASKVSDTFGLSLEAAQAALLDHKHEIDRFWSSKGPQTLAWIYQAPPGSQPEAGKRLQAVADLTALHLDGKALLLTRDGSSSSTDAVSCMELLPCMTDALTGLLASLSADGAAVTVPLLRRPDPAFFTLSSSGSASSGTFELPLSSAGAAHVAGLLEEWCAAAEAALTAGDGAALPVTLESELSGARQRAAALGRLVAEARSAEIAEVCRVATATAPMQLQAWRAAEAAVGEASTLAQDRVAVLEQLAPALAPFFGAPGETPIPDLQSALARAFQKIRAATAASRAYSTLSGAERLLGVLGAGLAQRARVAVTAGGPNLWDQPRPSLLSTLYDVTELYGEYDSLSRQLLRDLAPPAKGSGEAAEAAAGTATAGFAHVSRRCGKLRLLFTAVERFATLERQARHIPGVSAIATAFSELVVALRRGPAGGPAAALLAPPPSPPPASGDPFDRDILDFQVHVNDLELTLQEALRAAFDAAPSTDAALGVLRQHAALLPADVVDAEVDYMYAAAFRRFATDIEAVQEHYERHKSAPPVPRGATPAAGAIQWARALLSRVDRPMRQFAAHEPLIAAKESKKTIRSYNRLAQTLLEFEGLVHAAWVKSAESAVDLLKSPVLVQHPGTKQLHVNLDAAAARALAEGAALGRLGLPLPDRVRRAMLAAEGLKSHHAALTAAVAAMAGAAAALPPALQPLGTALAKVPLSKASPGLSTVFWTSATLDGFIHAFSAAVHRFCEVASRAADVHTNRVESAASAASSLQFMDLEPSKDGSSASSEGLLCANFAAAQVRQLAAATEALAAADARAAAAADEVVDLVSREMESVGLKMEAKAAADYRRHCAGLVRSKARAAAAAAADALVRRLSGNETSSKHSNPNPAALLCLELRLEAPSVAVHPSLAEVKSTLSSAISAVLAAVDALPAWPGTAVEEESGKGAAAKAARNPAAPRRASALVPRGAPQKEKASNDSEASNAATLAALAAAVDAMGGAVAAHVAAFRPFEFLWTQDAANAYETFMQGDPSLEESESQLRSLGTLAADLEEAPAVVRLGAGGGAALATAPLKHALRAEIAGWKTAFSTRLHDRAREQLAALRSAADALAARLTRRLEDLTDVAAVVQALSDAREDEGDGERRVQALEELYAMLGRHGVRVPKSETEALGDFAYARKAVRQAVSEASRALEAAQGGFVADTRALGAALANDSAGFRAAWEARGPEVPGLEPTEATARLERFKVEFEGLKRRWEKLAAGETLLGLPRTPLPGLERTSEDIAALDQLYVLYGTVMDAVKDRAAAPWAAAAAGLDALVAAVGEWGAAARRMPKALREWQAYKDCRRTVDDLAALLPLLQGLVHPAVRDRHWTELAASAAAPLPLPSQGLTLGHLMAAGLPSRREEVEELCAGAVKEETLERKLRALEAQWATETLTFADHKSRGPVVLKPAETAELMERLEDSAMALGSMAASRHAAPFRPEIQSLQGRLGAVSEAMEQWLAVQAAWAYMESVFTGGDIVKQLPAEAKRFQAVDRAYVKMVGQVREGGGRVLDACAGDANGGAGPLRSLLPHLLEQLELCQKSLSAYLETKRAEFPRFYFVSDPTLLEILSLGSDPAAVVPHFQSGLFDSLANVTFDPADKNKITEMWSREGERVVLARPVDARGPVEVWLQRLVAGMQDTMRSLIRQTASAAKSEDLDLSDFLFNRPAQVALLGLQLRWTADTAAALVAASKDEKGALSRSLKRAEATLRGLVELALRTDLTRLQRTALETCITVYIHQKEATEELVRKKVRNPRDFEWLRQCRLTWRDDKDSVQISICDVDLEYSYEYLGVKERLVITPLTDVCYVTLTQALGMCLGGAPAGPAGTGKTETTKDLGATLGKYVVVFNCSDQMDHKGMGKIFKGLAQSGLWGCFDEFNRINLDVLSVCAAQVGCVLGALRERRSTFTFTDGSTVPLDPRVGFFITMNPGYAGRQELPENLKALFRGVTMMAPNRQTIMQVKLAAAGFQENEALAKKFNVLYALCEQQLSKQPHYDFGLRNILAVLRTAGAAKRAAPDEPESQLILRTLRDMNMSKFVAEDAPLFLALLDDLFPAIKAPRAPAADVAAALERVCRERGLQPHAPWLEKCIQLYETSLVRHGIMVVGPPGAGKSTAIDCLAAALTELGQKTVVWRMNPKAITAPQMFGRMDAATGDWTDGVFATLWRRAARAPKGQSTWIVLDGPVDAVWIENLNTVLDDNKVLTLANGDRVLMTPAMRLIFEPENLNNASPATVSRAGIIYMSASELGWGPVVDSWLQGRPEREAVPLRRCFDALVGPVLDFVRLNCSPVTNVEPVCLVNTLLSLLTGALGSSSGGGGTAGQQRRASIVAAERAAGSDQGTSKLLEKHFLFCLAWSLGGLLGPEDRRHLDAFLRTLSTELPTCAAGDTLYEHYVDEYSGEWGHWAAKVPVWRFPASSGGTGGTAPRFTQMVVPTLDTVRYEHLLGLARAAGRAALLVGGPGTAKTTTLQRFLSSPAFDPDAHVAKTLTFSSLTTPALFQAALEAAVEKRQGRTFGPAGGKSATILLDDLAMPRVNQWGDQVTNELVRQVLEQGEWYSTEKPVGELKQLADVAFVAAMATPGAGRADIPNRLKRHFCIFHLPAPSEAVIEGVFGQLVAGHFAPGRCDAAVAAAAPALVPATMRLWAAAQARLLPTPAKLHYSFTLRDISKVFQGVMMADLGRMSGGSGGGTGGGGGEINGVGMSGGGGGSSSGGGGERSGEGLTGEAHLVALWAHECRRVFADKLISPEDKAWVGQAVVDSAAAHFHSAAATAAAAEGPVFADFLRDAPIDESTGEPAGPRPHCYELAPGGTGAIRRRVESLVATAREGARPGEAPPDLVLFDDALSHVLRVSRVLGMDRGSALLVGVGGSGKQSAAAVAAHLAGATVFRITPSKTYGVANLLEDLKNVYKAAALRPHPVAFILTESDIKDEAFLEYINQILSTGEVPGLFPREELDALLAEVRPLMRAASPGSPDTWDALYSFFINRVRDRLHLVLCLSPVGPAFGRWAQQFPALLSGCTIDWFLPWPQEALLKVSSRLLGASPDLAALPPGRLPALQRLMSWVHTRVTTACTNYTAQYRRAAHVTPKSFISALEAFSGLHAAKLAHLRASLGRLEAGLAKMATAKEDVGHMRVELAEKEKGLVVASAEAERLLAEISESTAAAERERAKVAAIVAAVTAKASEIAAVRADAEADLAAAQPALDAALSALNSITPKDIVSLKALKSPPDVVKRIFDTVLLLRHLPVGKAAWQDFKGAKVLVGSYDEAVRMMGDMNFLASLLAFPKESINDETMELLQPYFAAPDFNFEAAKKASGNVAGLCNWAAAMCRYHEVAKAVEPKIVALRAAEGELRRAEAERAAAESELAAVQEALDAQQVRLEAAVAQKAALEADAAATRRKMDNASTLVGALGGEEARWAAQAAGLRAAEDRLTGDCALACAFLSYLGHFNRPFRETLLAEVAAACADGGVPLTPDLDVASFLVEDTEVAQWAVEGLPTDPLSLQNGALVTRAVRWPLLVDPQGQGRAWLARREGPAGLRIINMGDSHFRAALEDCLSGGKPLLVENVEEALDPALDPVLERRFAKRGRSLTVMLGDKEVEVAPGFKLFLTCRLPAPRFAPEIFAKVAVIDFTVTPSGLEDQLLGALVLREKRELEEQRRRLVEDVASYRHRVAQLESDLLTRLSSSSGNLLDDTELIDVLAMTKATATEVAAKMAGATDARRRLTAACEEYRPAAHRAMLLYFIVTDLSGVNCMYQTSLAQFTSLYEASIDGSERPVTGGAPARVAAIAAHFTASLFEYIQRGLFERHKLVFSFMIAYKVGLSAGSVSDAEVRVFLKLGAGDGPAGGAGVKKKPKEWIPGSVWRNVLLLAERLPGPFGELPEAVAREDAAWAAWYDLEAPEAAPLPGRFANTALSPFQRLCLVRAFREDRALVAAAIYVAGELGQAFVEPPPTNLERVWSGSGPRCPVVCLLSPGTDPTRAIEDLARRKKLKCFGVSMGQGQEVVARRLVAAASSEGHWVLLQNAHLGLPYLGEVEAALARLEAPHTEFRLWITCEPHPGVPIGLLHASLKVTNEAPVGLRAGLRASLQWVTQDLLDAVPRREWRSLLYSLCFLHSIVQERRKFGPIGWNVPYEFNASDLAASAQALQNHVADAVARRAPGPDWPTLRYMVATIQYGGRITDERDRELMAVYAARYFREEVLTPGAVLYEPLASAQVSAKGRQGAAATAAAAQAVSAAYTVPEGSEIEVFRAAVENLSGQDTPELFGLHSNADLTFRALQVAEAVAVVEATLPKDGAVSSGGAASAEDGLDRVAADLLARLPPAFGATATAEALRRLPGGPTAPLNIHLRQEVERLDKVRVMVEDGLKTLRLAAAGTIAMTDAVAAVAEAVAAGRPPSAWVKVSWESPALGSWFQGFLTRHAQLAGWLHSGRPKSFWLPGFFNPQGFLTAVKQEVTRKHAAEGWALDDVIMTSQVTRTADPAALREGPGEGVFIHGLWLEGAAWSAKDGKLVDPEPKKLYSPLPVLHVSAARAGDAAKKSGGMFEAPCYRVRRRTAANYIASFSLRADEERAKWVLRGAALVCSVE